MKISNLNNTYKNVNFASSNSADDFNSLDKSFKLAKKTNASKDVFDNLYKSLSELETRLKPQIKEKNIPWIFKALVKYCGKIKTQKTGNKVLDSATQLTKIVLWGNVGKEAVGTTLYTIQALTNQDLPEDKRKFVGMYDLAVGLVSTTFSFIFGVGLEKSIKNKYKTLLKPLTDSPNAAIHSRAGAAIVGLAAFSSFALQTIVGKRIIAPAIATPAAGRLKKRLEESHTDKNKKVEPKQNAVVYTKQGFVDLKKSKFNLDK